MSSPVEEVTHTTTQAAETTGPSVIETEEVAFGADEERLVQMAHREAMLRLARAM